MVYTQRAVAIEEFDEIDPTRGVVFVHHSAEFRRQQKRPSHITASSKNPEGIWIAEKAQSLV